MGVSRARVYLVEASSVFPAADARKEYARLRNIYKSAGVAQQLVMNLFDGCHEINAPPILNWFKTQLRLAARL